MAEVQRIAAHPLTAVAEPERLERTEVARRTSRVTPAWVRTAFLLDAGMLLAAAAAAGLGARSAGVQAVSVLWLAAYVVVALVFLHSRSLYDWHLRLQTLDDVRSVLVATVLAAMTIVFLRVIVPGDLDEVASQTLRVAAFSAVYVAAGRVALDWSQVRARRRRRGRPSDPRRRRRPRRPPRRPPPARAPRARAQAGRLPRQGAARRPAQRAPGPRRELGPRAGDRRARDRARRDHVLDRAERRPAPRAPPLRRARRRGLGRAASLRAGDAPDRGRPPRRPAAAPRPPPRPEGLAVRVQVHRRPRRRRAPAPALAPADARGRARRADLARLARSSSARGASASTAASSRC